MKMKQCIVQFDNGSYYHGWLDVNDAIEGKDIKITNKILNLYGFINATVLKVYHSIILDD